MRSVALGVSHEGELSKGEDKVINNALCKRQISKGFCPTLKLPATSCENWAWWSLTAFLFPLPVSDEGNLKNFVQAWLRFSRVDATFPVSE